MKTVQQWFSEYGESHQNRKNIIIHKFCVPLITWSLLGIMWTIPIPEFFYGLHLNWAYVFCMICVLFYMSLKSVKLLIAIFFLIAPAIFVLEKYSSVLGYRLLYISLGIFVLAWIGQFIGHKIEGKKPSFLEDIQFLLIGPGWIFKDLLKITNK